jgi:hypothetical protein
VREEYGKMSDRNCRRSVRIVLLPDRLDRFRERGGLQRTDAAARAQSGEGFIQKGVVSFIRFIRSIETASLANLFSLHTANPAYMWDQPDRADHP